MSDPIPASMDLCWPLDPGCLGEEWLEYSVAVRARATALATATLYRLTLGLVGGCPITVRPCNTPNRPDTSYGGFGSPWMMPLLMSGAWVNCACTQRCGCTTGCQIELPRPVGSVTEVTVAGEVIAEDDYKLIGNRIVYQGSSTCPFPKHQDLSTPADAAGSFTVTYTPGKPVDGLGAWAAGTLAAEFAKACTGSKGCKLPKNVTSITRQGVSQELIVGTFPNGLTGLREVDAYVALFNPNPGKTLHASAVWSPDLPHAVMEA